MVITLNNLQHSYEVPLANTMLLRGPLTHLCSAIARVLYKMVFLQDSSLQMTAKFLKVAGASLHDGSCMTYLGTVQVCH